MADEEFLDVFRSCLGRFEDSRSGYATLRDLNASPMIAPSCVLCGGHGAADMALFAEAKEPFCAVSLSWKTTFPVTMRPSRFQAAVRQRSGSRKQFALALWMWR